MKLQLINDIIYEDPIKQVLHNRGIEDINHFFNIDWSCVQDPTALDNIEEGAQLLYNHLTYESKILIIVD